MCVFFVCHVVLLLTICLLYICFLLNCVLLLINKSQVETTKKQCLSRYGRPSSAAAAVVSLPTASKDLQSDLQENIPKQSALHIACHFGLTGTVAKLVTFGADAFLKDAVRACPYVKTRSYTYSIHLCMHSIYTSIYTHTHTPSPIPHPCGLFQNLHTHTHVCPCIHTHVRARLQACIHEEFRQGARERAWA